MAQIIRMTEDDLKNIVKESVIRILNEGEAWQAFASAFNGKGLAQYAKDRIWDKGNKKPKVGEDPIEKQKQAWGKEVKKHLENGGTIDNDGNMVGGNNS